VNNRSCEHTVVKVGEEKHARTRTAPSGINPVFAVPATFHVNPVNTEVDPDVVPACGHDPIGVEDPAGLTSAVGMFAHTVLVAPGDH
jgi:hypothetical protein